MAQVEFRDKRESPHKEGFIVYDADCVKVECADCGRFFCTTREVPAGLATYSFIADCPHCGESSIITINNIPE